MAGVFGCESKASLESRSWSICTCPPERRGSPRNEFCRLVRVWAKGFREAFCENVELRKSPLFLRKGFKKCLRSWFFQISVSADNSETSSRAQSRLRGSGSTMRAKTRLSSSGTHSKTGLPETPTSPERMLRNRDCLADSLLTRLPGQSTQHEHHGRHSQCKDVQFGEVELPLPPTFGLSGPWRSTSGARYWLLPNCAGFESRALVHSPKSDSLNTLRALCRSCPARFGGESPREAPKTLLDRVASALRPEANSPLRAFFGLGGARERRPGFARACACLYCGSVSSREGGLSLRSSSSLRLAGGLGWRGSFCPAAPKKTVFCGAAFERGPSAGDPRALKSTFSGQPTRRHVAVHEAGGMHFLEQPADVLQDALHVAQLEAGVGQVALHQFADQKVLLLFAEAAPNAHHFLLRARRNGLAHAVVDVQFLEESLFA